MAGILLYARADEAIRPDYTYMMSGKPDKRENTGSESGIFEDSRAVGWYCEENTYRLQGFVGSVKSFL